jgi:hypothetical protein
MAWHLGRMRLPADARATAGPGSPHVA